MKTCADVMTMDPVSCLPDEKISDVALLMKAQDIGPVLIVDSEVDQRLVGIITDRDIAIRHVAEGHTSTCRVSDHMTSRIKTVREDDDLSDVEEIMADEQIRRVPVVDEDDHLVGMIAQADIARQDSSRDVGETVRDISRHGGDHTT